MAQTPIEEIREKALDYSRNLPNFLCTQMTRRYTAKPVRNSGQPSWQPVDILTIELSYFEQKENYRLVKLNDKPTTKLINKLSGNQSRGDFGSVLRSVFQADTQTTFSREPESQVDGKPVMIFSYAIDLAHARFGTYVMHNGHKRSISWAAKGEIYVDSKTLEVLRITRDSVDIPPDFPVQASHLELDYGRQKVGEQEFLLPLRSDSSSRFKDGKAAKEETVFTNYRKFTADTAIQFEP